MHARWQQLLLLIGVAVRASKQDTSSTSDAYDHVNLLIGNGGDTPNGSGGMIPSTAPPFAMTRWVAQTHENFVSRTPYNWTASSIHGFQGTRQPAIWMGESGPVIIVPGVTRSDQAKVKQRFEDRGLTMRKDTEKISPAYYSITLDDGLGGEVQVEQSATSRVGHLRFTFSTNQTPYIFLESSRPSVITSTPTNITYPNGTVSISLDRTSRVHEICGSNSERQDHIITPVSTQPHVANFNGYYCARFEYEGEAKTQSGTKPFGVVSNDTMHPGTLSGSGPLLGGYVLLPSSGKGKTVVNVRVGTSFISIDQARKNIDAESPDGTALEGTVQRTKQAWTDKLDRFVLEGASEVQKEVFWTGVAHALTYPSEQHEQNAYYSGYDGTVHRGPGVESYTSYSIWDTYRAEWAFLILFAPERLPGMVRSMLSDYKEGGWLPMWKNIVETNIMVGTHADSLVAEAVVKGVEGFDRELAWQAVWKDATVAPRNDQSTSYFDREENVDYEVRAGLSTVYAEKGWVADDVHSESASRTLDYAYDDYAAYKLAHALGKPESITNLLLQRSMNAPFTLFNNATGFMEARNANGSWAGEKRGWTEGDKWAYSFDVVHDIPGLIKARGGNASFVKSLDDHFNGGHNDHTNEPSHHIPYLYAMAGAAHKTQEKVREIAQANYNNTPIGLSGNEDCGQMSAWYIFTAMGFYPVNPVSGEYVVGSPFFDKISIDLPPTPQNKKSRKLTISAPGAPTKPYVKSLTVNGRKVDWPIISHEEIKDGGEIVFEMSATPEAWGNGLLANVRS
ncbi:putative glycosyl hydrolase family 92 [Lyophyllum shimeji]|uniref:Glycosyl hydrolase family 92 n=1 Tax=Lyophyllum shimeji TaxID=47721 RepID=A0A9P3UHQ6_LYOSH|nr:putative glycosyl hydrolase family 92 [Lyophyllum shimeji]